ncbi:MnmC family methyltransferase, partial [Leptospira levettii]
SKNPKMWSEDTLSKLRSHSKTGTRFATFTAAGFIRRNLEGLGFMVQKQKGFGKKREMLTGILR